MSDMLVKLYELEYDDSLSKRLVDDGITVKKACIIDKSEILEFVKSNFPDAPGWVHECEYALFNNPVSCYIAVKARELIGFACYDATAKGFFGPTGVNEAFRGKGIGAELLMKCMFSMKESGYAYAVIGWPAHGAAEFYKKRVNATVIEGSSPNKSIYKNSISQQ